MTSSAGQAPWNRLVYRVSSRTFRSQRKVRVPPVNAPATELGEATASRPGGWKGPERRLGGRLYGRTATEITGPLQATSSQVRYRDTLSATQHRQVLILGGSHIALAAALAIYLLLPGHLPRLGGHDLPYVVAAVSGLIAMVTLQLIAGVRTWTLVYHASRARDPIPMRAPAGLKVAVLTTIVPNKEPLELVLTTLRAMKQIRYDGVLDVWLLDEGNDPIVKRRCAELGVNHFSRRDVPAWNQPTGPYKAKTKHGNHNAWRAEHELDYDVVAQMDPDHVPFPNFLERTLGYFADPDTAFVVAPQVYGNLSESLVARGAAELAYIFHGIIQRGGNGHQAPRPMTQPLASGLADLVGEGVQDDPALEGADDGCVGSARVVAG